MSDSAVAMSSAEARFESWRRRLGFIAAPIVFATLWLIPITGLNDEAHRLLAVFGLVITLWISEAIPLAVTALLGPALCVVCGVMTEKEVFKSFGNPILFLFLGSFLVAEGMTYHGLNRRVAFSILSWPWIARKPGRILIAFGTVTGLLSMWISNTTAAAMMFPIGIAVLSEVARRRTASSGQQIGLRDMKFATSLMLMVAFGASIGGMATPVGTPPNLIGIGFIRETTGQAITFFQWMLFGLPLATTLVLFLAWHLNRTCRTEPNLSGDQIAWLGEQRSQLGKLTVGERNVLIAFGTTVTLWLTPGIVAATAGASSPIYTWLNRHFPEGVAALLGASLLFVLPIDRARAQFTLTWREATKIDWGTIMLFGGGLAIGEAMFETGLAKWIGEGVAEVFQARTQLSLITLFAVMAVLLTETTSNTAAANMLVPIAIAVSQAAGVNPIQPAIAVCLSASLAFMLPVSTPPNAIVYGSGCVPLMKMVRHGFVLDLVSVIGVVTVVYWVVPLVVR